MSYAKSDGARIEIVFTETIGPITPPVLGQEWRDIRDALVTTLNQNSISTRAGLLNDGLTSPYWYGTTVVNWIRIAMHMAQVVRGFRWYISDTTYWPKTFTVSGSNDGVNWAQLSDVLTGVGTVGWQTFYFPNEIAYRYYQINILTGNSSYRLYIAEVELYFDYGNESAFIITVPEYDAVPGGTIEYNRKRVDRIENKTGYTATVDLSDGELDGLQDDNGVLSLEVVLHG